MVNALGVFNRHAASPVSFLNCFCLIFLSGLFCFPPNLSAQSSDKKDGSATIAGESQLNYSIKKMARQAKRRAKRPTYPLAVQHAYILGRRDGLRYIKTKPASVSAEEGNTLIPEVPATKIFPKIKDLKIEAPFAYKVVNNAYQLGYARAVFKTPDLNTEQASLLAPIIRVFQPEVNASILNVADRALVKHGLGSILEPQEPPIDSPPVSPMLSGGCAMPYMPGCGDDWGGDCMVNPINCDVGDPCQPGGSSSQCDSGEFCGQNDYCTTSCNGITDFNTCPSGYICVSSGGGGWECEAWNPPPISAPPWNPPPSECKLGDFFLNPLRIEIAGHEFSKCLVDEGVKKFVKKLAKN